MILFKKVQIILKSLQLKEKLLLLYYSFLYIEQVLLINFFNISKNNGDIQVPIFDVLHIELYVYKFLSLFINFAYIKNFIHIFLQNITDM